MGYNLNVFQLQHDFLLTFAVSSIYQGLCNEIFLFFDALNKYIGQAWWHNYIPTTWEAEARGSLELKSLRPARQHTEILSHEEIKN